MASLLLSSLRILLMIGIHSAFDPVLPVLVQSRVGPLRFGFCTACPSQVNNSERPRWVGSGEEYIVTTDVSCDGSDRDIE